MVIGRSYMMAFGFLFACCLAAIATSAKASRPAPLSCMYLFARRAISSAGRDTPYGLAQVVAVTCSEPGSRRAAVPAAQGRPPEPRLRDRQATPTFATPVAIAMAR